MKKYEYLKVQAKSLSTGLSISIDRLNKLGEDGWEMVMMTNWNNNPAFIYFKRVKSQTCIRCHGRGIAPFAGGGVSVCGVCDGKGEV